MIALPDAMELEAFERIFSSRSAIWKHVTRWPRAMSSRPSAANGWMWPGTGGVMIPKWVMPARELERDLRTVTLPADDAAAGGLGLVIQRSQRTSAEARAGRLEYDRIRGHAPRRCAGRRCRDCGTGCPGRSDAARDSGVRPAPRAPSRCPPGVSIESSSCSCRSRGEPSLSYSCAPSTRSVLKKLTNVRTPSQTYSVRPGNAPTVHQREHAGQERQHRDLPSPHAPRHRRLHHAAVVGIHRERGGVHLEPAMKSRPDQADRRQNQKAQEQQDRDQHRRLQREDDNQPPRAGKRQILRILLCPVGRQAVMALVHADVGERRQQQRDAEQQFHAVSKPGTDRLRRCVSSCVKQRPRYSANPETRRRGQHQRRPRRREQRHRERCPADRGAGQQIGPEHRAVSARGDRSPDGG